MMNAEPATSIAEDARRAFVLNDRPIIVDLIELTLNHGLFVVRSAQNFAEATRILETWGPDIAVLDMDHEDTPQVLHRLGASNTLRPSATPILGLTRRGDLATKLRAFDLGVDDILTIPFSPEELLARSIVITAAILATGPAARVDDHARGDGDRHPPSRGPDGHLGRAPDEHRAEPAVRAGEPGGQDGDARGDPRRRVGSRLHRREQHRRPPRPEPADQAPERLSPAAVHRDRPGKGYRFIPTFSNEGWNAEQPSE